MKVYGTKQEYQAQAHEAEQKVKAAQEALDVKLKPFEARIKEIDSKISQAQSSRKSVKEKKSHVIFGVLAAIFGFLGAFLYVPALIIAVALLITFFVVKSKNHAYYSNLISAIDTKLEAWYQEKRNMGSDDPEICELRKIIEDENNNWAFALDMLDNITVYETIGGNGIVIAVDDSAICKYQFYNNINSDKVNVESNIKLDGASRGGASNRPLILPLSSGLHTMSVEMSMPSKIHIVKDLYYTLPNYGQFETIDKQFKLDNEVKFFVYKDIVVDGGLDFEVITVDDVAAFCREAKLSQDSFMSYIHKL